MSEASLARNAGVPINWVGRDASIRADGGSRPTFNTSLRPSSPSTVIEEHFGKADAKTLSNGWQILQTEAAGDDKGPIEPLKLKDMDHVAKMR